MTTKTAGQAALEEFMRQEAGPGPHDWDRIAASARDWTPPPQPTLGEINYRAFNGERGEETDWPGCPLKAEFHAGGVVCARVGAERERAEIRALICKNRTYSSIQDVLALIDARGKEQANG